RGFSKGLSDRFRSCGFQPRASRFGCSFSHFLRHKGLCFISWKFLLRNSDHFTDVCHYWNVWSRIACLHGLFYLFGNETLLGLILENEICSFCLCLNWRG